MPDYAYPECDRQECLKPLAELLLMCAWTKALKMRIAGKAQAVDAVLGTDRLFWSSLGCPNTGTLSPVSGSVWIGWTFVRCSGCTDAANDGCDYPRILGNRHSQAFQLSSKVVDMRGIVLWHGQLDRLLHSCPLPPDLSCRVV